MSEELLLYLDNVDEYVNDENKIVTYKWLSKTLKIHVNLAKRLLFMFIQQERNKKDNDDLSVTYFVAGLHTDNDGMKKHSCFVVPETDLNGVRTSLSPVTSCHIYSVHKVKLKDSNALYTTDFEKIKENIFDASSYSAIKYKKAKPQSQEELSKQSQVSANQNTPSIPEKVKQTAPVSNNTSSVNKKKTDGKNNIASMFSQQSKPVKKEVVGKPEPQKTEESKKPNKEPQKKEGVKSFFKTNDKRSPNPPATIKKIEEEVDVNKNKKSPEKSSSTKSRKGKQSDSDDRKNTSKRRRIKSEVFDSSSEDEMEVLSPEEEEEPFPVRTEEEPEEIVPPTPSPPKNKTPVSNQSESGGRKRKRIKKLVTKTYKDEDGFMLTEKIYETDSTDASESDKEDPLPKNVKTGMTNTEHSKQTTQKRKSPPKKASPVKGKQTSLTSFFKKK